MKTLKIHTTYIRLSDALKLARITATGGEAKQMISDGQVQVNGEPCLLRGKKLLPGDRFTAGGETYEITA